VVEEVFSNRWDNKYGQRWKKYLVICEYEHLPGRVLIGLHAWVARQVIKDPWRTGTPSMLYVSDVQKLR
jgi:hypothetical protein